MDNKHYNNLINTVIDKSESSNWENAVLEWKIRDKQIDFNQTTPCICGKENLKYLFTIQNQKNNNILKYIGSTCIKKFKREELDKITTTYTKLCVLYYAIKNNEYIEFNANFFSKQLIEYFEEQNIIKPSRYNNYEPKKDYDFMKKMFFKRKEPTEPEQKKIKAIMVNSIKPYLIEQVKEKTK